jgi:hypothetical protein
MISNWFTAESKHCGSFSRNGIQLKRRGKKKSIIIIILWIEFLNEKRLLDQFSGLNGMFSARSIFFFLLGKKKHFCAWCWGTTEQDEIFGIDSIGWGTLRSIERRRRRRRNNKLMYAFGTCQDKALVSPTFR